MERTDAGLLAPAGARPAGASRYTVGIAATEYERRAAQRLRWRVFADELGARLPAREPGIDHDMFDPFCEHIVAREAGSGEVIGTYRLLAPESARRIGCYYSESEFDLTRLQLLRDRMVELGRSCIHPDHRSGMVIALLWSAIARYMLAGNYAYLAGCASLSMADGGHAAASLFERLRARYMAPVEYRVFPRSRLPLDELDAGRRAEPPPLVRGYLRAGARVCSEPAFDPDFNTADLFLLLPMAQLGARHQRHFLGADGLAS
jgi:putative hemolysin